VSYTAQLSIEACTFKFKVNKGLLDIRHYYAMVTKLEETVST